MKLNLDIFGYSLNAKHLIVFGIIYVIIMCTTMCGCIDISNISTEGFLQREPISTTTNKFQQNMYINGQWREFLLEPTMDPEPTVSRSSLLIE